MINNRKYFSFSFFKQNGNNVTNYCRNTFGSSSHNIGVNPLVKFFRLNSYIF